VDCVIYAILDHEFRPRQTRSPPEPI